MPCDSTSKLWKTVQDFQRSPTGHISLKVLEHALKVYEKTPQNKSTYSEIESILSEELEETAYSGVATSSPCAVRLPWAEKIFSLDIGRSRDIFQLSNINSNPSISVHMTSFAALQYVWL